MNRFYCLLFLLALLSCREPMVSDHFIKGEGPYVYVVDMSDTLASYGFDLYTRLDVPVPRDTLPLLLEWTSPSSALSSEIVCLPLAGREDAFSRQVYVPLRDGVRPVEAGVWALTVSVADSVRIKGMSGLGFVCNKKRQDGTR